MSRKAVVVPSFLQSPFFCDEWRSRFVLHDAPIDVTYASVLLLLVPPSSICCFPLIAGAKSLVTPSSVDVKVQVYANIDKDMLQSFDTETIHGTQRASFASTSEQPPKEFLTPWHSLHSQILFSNVVPMSSLQNSNMWDQYRLVNYSSNSPTLPRLIHTSFFLICTARTRRWSSTILLSSRDLPLHTKPVGPTLRTQFMTGTFTCLGCIVSEKWKPSTTEPLKFHSLMTLPCISFLGCSTTSFKCSLSWIDKHWTC